MGREWRQILLEDLAEDLTVGYVGPMASEYVTTGIPFLRSLNVEPGHINNSDLKFINPAFHERLKKSALAPGDVVIVRTGKPGTCAVIPETLPVSNCSDLVIVRCGPHLDARFLSYFINSAAAHHVNSHLVGAVQQHFNVGSARKILIFLPDLPEQRAIAHILGTLDDRIELNRRMNETLEAMARALFKSWFVDFDPVRAKAEGRDPGLPKHLADLFPDSFDDSELGEIPKGWEVGPLLKFSELLSGGTPKTDRSEYWNGEILWASAKDVSQCRETFLMSTERTITPRGLAESATQLIPALATAIVARGATTGRMAIFGADMAMNQTCYALRSRIGRPFTLYCQLQNAIGALVHAAHGSVFDTITTATFARSLLLQPSLHIVDSFEKIISPIFLKIRATTAESSFIATTRDTLLPKLLSGEIRLKDAERFVAANL